MKPDMTKARGALLEATHFIKTNDDEIAIQALHDAVKAIIDALDPPPVEFDWATVKP